MTRLLESVFDRARALPEAEQDRVAQLVKEALDAAHGWDDRFAATSDGLAQLAREALERDARGESIEKGWDEL